MVAGHLPDFRNLGIVLRSLLIVEGLFFILGASFQPNLKSGVLFFFNSGHLREPILIASLATLFLFKPLLSRMPYTHGISSVIFLAFLIALLVHISTDTLLPGLITGTPIRTGILAILAAGFVLAYFDWRHRALSPALSEARLSALQSRIRPHFLFNSLNTVLSLIRPDPRRAELVLENLADLFRALMADPRNLVPLERELDLTRAYLEIEGIRLGDRLKVTWQCGEGLEHVAVPQLLLQPLVENAVVHGIEPSAAPGVIQIEISARGKQLVISVSNSLPKDNATGGELRPGNHMALDNIRERLDLHFDAEANMRQAIQDGQFVVRVEMPLAQLSRHAPGALGRDGSLSR